MRTYDWSNRRRGRVEDDNGNGRITTAVLKQTVMDVEKKLDYIINRVDGLSESAHRYDERIKSVERDVDELGRRSNRNDGLVAAISTAAAAIAAMLGLTR